MINVELFSCAGGMAAGFRRAGIEFDIAVDLDPNHCDSYARNLGHRPEQLDARGLLAVLRRIRRGERVVDGPYDRVARRLLSERVDLLVADPPCTPWSRAGKRMGMDDDRDMLAITCTLIAILRPRRYLIGNVPGLEDGTNLKIVHRTIGALAQRGYCVADFLLLDAANYGVPQHRWRPFWYGHKTGPCLRPTQPTHTDPVSAARPTLPGFAPLKPWVTCRDALGHLAPEALGRPVKMRRREQNGKQCGSVPDRPPSFGDEPAMTVRAGCGQGATRAVEITGRKKRPPSTKGPQSTRTISPDRPSTTVQAREDRLGSGSPVLDWPWQRPATTIQRDDRIAPPGHHDESFAIMSLPDAVILSERAACILQGFPDDGSWTICGATKKARWGQIGMAMPPALAEAVARAIVEQDCACLCEVTPCPCRCHPDGGIAEAG